MGLDVSQFGGLRCGVAGRREVRSVRCFFVFLAERGVWEEQEEQEEQVCVCGAEGGG